MTRGESAERPEVPVHHGLDDEDVEGGERGGLHRRREPAEQRPQGDHRQQQFPLRVPGSAARLAPVERSRTAAARGAWQIPQSAVRTTSSIPGTIPPRNISLMSTPR